METKLYLRMLQRGWWIITVTALAAVCASLLYSYYTPSIFRATTRFVISPSAEFLSGVDNNVLSSLATLDRVTIITTYAELLNSPRLQNEALDELNLNREDLPNYSYNAIVLPDTTVIEFTVDGTDPNTVTLLANSIGQNAVEYVTQLQQVYDMIVLDPAIIPEEPISPLPLRDAGVTLIVGLAAGVMLALIRDLISSPIENFMQQRNLDNTSLAFNRDYFEKQLSDVALGSVDDFSLCMVHLDGLGDYLNVLPQPTLQKVLRHVNQTLRNQLRGNDMVGRWSDLDFIVMLSEARGYASMNTMERVKSALSIPIRIDITGEDLYLKPEIGIAEYRVGDTSESLLKNLNWALNVAQTSQAGIYLLKATEPI